MKEVLYIMNLNEKTLKAEYKYRGAIINMRVDDALLPDGNTAKREVVEHGGGVCVVPVNEKGEITVVRQFRYPYMKTVVEIPAGKLDKGEKPLACGIRELKEETGCTADNMIFLGELYPSPGYCGEIITMYAATGLHSGEQDTDDDEFLEVDKISISDFVDKILAGEIQDAKTQTAVLKAYELIRRGEITYK